MNPKLDIDMDTQTVRQPADPAGLGGTPPLPAARHTPQVGVDQLDARGQQCPGPIMQLNRRLGEMTAGDRLRVLATDPGFLADVKSWSAVTGNRLIESGPDNGHYAAVVEKVAAAPAAEHDGDTSNGGFTAVVFSGAMDKALAALVLANGAAAMGRPATLFFTFWGLSVLRKPRPARGLARGLLDRMFAWMLPAGLRKLKLSQWHFAGFGRLLMNYRMKSKNVMNLEQLMSSARQAGVRLVACQMSLDMLGLRKEDLIDGVELGGVANFMESASAGRVSLFI